MVFLVIKKESDAIRWYKAKCEGLINSPYMHFLTLSPSHLPTFRLPTPIASYLLIAMQFPKTYCKAFFYELSAMSWFYL